MWNLFRRQKSPTVEKDDGEGAALDEEEIENNIKEVNIIRGRVAAERWIAPIDLALSSVKNMRLRKLNWRNMTDMPNKMKATNTGNTVIVSAKWNHMRPHLRGGSLLSTYVFSQLHFHWGSSEHEGSEHRINGISYPLEMHVVFFKSLYLTQDVALTKEDGVVTVVYLFKLASELNEVLNLITSKLVDIRQAHSSTAIDPTPLGTLLYPFTEDYFMYWGKLQTTVCEHPVLWIVSRHAFGVTQSQLKEFRTLLSYNDESLVKNFREPSPLNERPVFHVNPSSNLDMVLLPGVVKQDLQLITVMYNYINECYNKYHSSSKNTSKNMCGDSTKVDFNKTILPDNEKLTKYDHVYNTMQSSGIKILFLLREITNILHQRILQGGTNYSQNHKAEILANKENVAGATCIEHLKGDGDRQSTRMRSVRRNTEPSILIKPKLCKNRNINSKVRLKQASSKHSAVSNRQNCLTRNKTFSSFHRPTVNLTQSDITNISPIDLSTCKQLFSPQNNIRKPDEKLLVSKIQSKTNRSNMLKQVKEKKAVAPQDNAILLKTQTSKTNFFPSDRKIIAATGNKNWKKIADDSIFFKPLAKPYLKELATIEEESKIISKEAANSLNTSPVNEDNKISMVGPCPSLNQFGLTQNDGISQTMLLEENTAQEVSQIQNSHKDLDNNRYNALGVRKLAVLSKQLMNIFHLSNILPDNESHNSCNLNTNSINEQKVYLDEANGLVDIGNKPEIDQNISNVKQDKSDDIKMKNRMPASLNHLLEDTGIETNKQETVPIKNYLNSTLLQTNKDDSQTIQSKNCVLSNQIESDLNALVMKECNSHPKLHNMLNHLDVNSTHCVTTNNVITNLLYTDLQESCPNKTEIADKVGVNLTQRNTKTKQPANEEHRPQQECYSIRNETTVISNEGGTNIIDKCKKKLLNVVTEETIDKNCKSGNEIISQGTQNSSHKDEDSYCVRGDYTNIKLNNNISNFTSFSKHELCFKSMKQISHKDVCASQTENYRPQGNQWDMNSTEISTDTRQEFSNTNKETNNDFNNSEKYSGKDKVESYCNNNEHIYYDDDEKKTIKQIHKKLLSLFSEKDDNETYNMNSELEKIIYKAISQNISEENVDVVSNDPMLMGEVKTTENRLFSKQLTSLYENSNFENGATNPNSVTSSRMPSVSSVHTDKSLVNKVEEQVNNIQKHLCRTQKKCEEPEEQIINRENTTHDNSYSKDTAKLNILLSEARNAKTRISKIPKPIPVYTKANKKLETKIPKPATRPGTIKEVKYATGPHNSLKSVYKKPKNS